MTPDDASPASNDGGSRWRGEPTGAPSVSAAPPPAKKKPPIAAKKPAADLPPSAEASEPVPPSTETWEDSRSLLNRHAIENTASFLASLIFHLAALLTLALFVIEKTKPPTEVALLIHADVEEVFEPELETVVLDQQEHAATMTTLLRQGGDPTTDRELTQTPTVNMSDLSQVFEQDSYDSPTVEIGTALDEYVPRSQILVEVPHDAPGVARAVVEGYSDALDRITEEIRDMLYQRPVLVVWCFDRSESMKDDQEEIRQRIDRVYTELGLFSHASGGALKTAITSYGSRFWVDTPEPTHDRDKISAAIAALTPDPSGKEIMCEAVARAIVAFDEYASRGNRQMVLILVTDESGEHADNVSNLERTIAVAHEAKCRTYVLGREAVFGYPYVRFRYQHPQTNRIHWLIADRGPETAFVEQLQTNGFHRRHDAFASGFGPYEQSRLARETGGIFFLLPSKEASIVRGEKRLYELEQMKYYRPDLRSREEIFFDRDQSELQLLLWKVVSDLNPYNPQSNDITELRVHFSPDPVRFVRQMNEQIGRANTYQRYLATASRVVESAGELRERELHPRWRANYDLMRAQLIAYQARLFEYNAYLKLFMQNPVVVPLAKPPNLRLVYWDIRTRTETLTGEVIEPYVEKANELFQHVIDTHPGTPWAERARWEMKRGYGVELRPVYHPPYRSVPNSQLKPLPKL
jgi:hypothetical protein